ncbi:7552_t:CDS:2 [Ambispora leptoticha]|uniref:Fructose-bisphosphate aldolase n=1 Tax=Ambispora leptoticha TaxID=144679 RepID=A0A9N9CAH5_9GLOM|nr:7552_t:CDS:2 [Ambispora leptoticha]
MGLLEIVPTDVITGDNVRKLFQYAHENNFAIPAVNVSSSSTINAALEAARDIKAPLIIQLSQGGSQFYAGKGLSNEGQRVSIAQLLIMFVVLLKSMEFLHSDHCAKKLLPWFEGMLEADEEYFAKHGEPLFSSHMLDLSEESKDENIAICKKYLERMKKVNLLLEMEIGLTGGEEDGVDNTGLDNASLYTLPEDVWDVYRNLSEISDLFTIAAAFGNVHGVYKPGNVKLSPILLKKHQEYIKEKTKAKTDKPVWLVFHGGSGSLSTEINDAVSYGVVKMNIDTDTQWAYWEGIRNFYESKKGYLQTQVGNPEGPDKPNKKYYDPRVFIREAEKSMTKRVQQACRDLGNVDRL